MSATATSGPYPQPYHDDEARRWVSGGFAGLFVLIGLAIALSIVVPVLRGENPAWPSAFTSSWWVYQLIGLVIGLWILMWIFRFAFWGLAGPGYWGDYYGRHGYRRYHRRGLARFDPAFGLARERYARGETTREQFDQITRDLGYPIE